MPSKSKKWKSRFRKGPVKLVETVIKLDLLHRGFYSFGVHPLSGEPKHQKLVAERGRIRLIDEFHGHSDKMASGERNNGDDQPGVIGNAGGTDSDFTDKEAALKLEKSRAKRSETSCCF